MPVQQKWQVFLKRYPTRVYRRGQIVLFQGESPRNAFVVKNGVIKRYNIDYDGKEQFIDLETSGSTFPKLWLWGKANNVDYYYEALADCLLYVIPRDAYVKFVLNDSELLQNELSGMLREYRNSSMRLNALLYTRASDKIAYILKYLANTYAPRTGDGNSTISIKLTHQHIASLTGLTRETVSVELNKLKKLGILSYKPAEYKVNLAKLDQILKQEF